MKNIGILDYGVGNLRSVYFAIDAVDGAPHLVNNHTDMSGMDALILPGVGAFAHTAKAFSDSGLKQSTLDAIDAGIPVLGICVGMQLLFDESQEFGVTRGLGLLRGAVQKIDPNPENDGRSRLPVIGWFRTLDLGPDRRGYYFLHSFAAQPDDPSIIHKSYVYQNATVTASVVSGNIMGTQFHPERSAQDGLELLSTFVSTGSIASA